MRLILQALVSSVVIHIIYLAAMTATGYIKTKNYKPDMENTWNDVETLQTEVAFGQTYSPLFFIVTFIGVALICGIIIYLYRKAV